MGTTNPIKMDVSGESIKLTRENILEYILASEKILQKKFQQVQEGFILIKGKWKRIVIDDDNCYYDYKTGKKLGHLKWK
jgi:hypothetical protein